MKKLVFMTPHFVFNELKLEQLNNDDRTSHKHHVSICARYVTIIIVVKLVKEYRYRLRCNGFTLSTTGHSSNIWNAKYLKTQRKDFL